MADSPCVFDVEADMAEHEDISSRRPEILALMLRQWDELATQVHPPNLKLDPPSGDTPSGSGDGRNATHEDLDGYCGAVALNGDRVGPWTVSVDL